MEEVRFRAGSLPEKAKGPIEPNLSSTIIKLTRININFG